MNNILLVLLLVCLAGLTVGLAKPSILRLTNRKQVSLYFGVGSMIFFFVLFGITTPKTQPMATLVSPASNVSDITATTSTASTTLALGAPGLPQGLTQSQNPATQDNLKAIVAGVLRGTTNMSHESRLRNVDVVPQVAGGWGVFVEFNANDNLTTNLTKEGIEQDMSEIYIALYTSDLDVKSASAAGYLSLTDKYGNTSDVMVYKSILEGDVARNVNWTADKASLELEILPGLWITTILNHALTS